MTGSGKDRTDENYEKERIETTFSLFLFLGPSVLWLGETDFSWKCFGFGFGF